MGIVDRINQVCREYSKEIALLHYQTRNSQKSITYGQLDKHSEILAYYLKSGGLLPGQLVGIFMPRGIEHIIAMIAILKCGAAFYSLNHRLSLTQVEYITSLCRSPFLLVDNSALIKFAHLEKRQFDKTMLLLMNDQPMNPVHKALLDKLAKHTTLKLFSMDDFKDSNTNISPPVITGNDLALALFTSGSTGVPKGVMISHQNLYDRVQGECRDFRLQQSDHLLSLLPFSFDVGLNQLFTALTTGAQLIILNSWLANDIIPVIKTFRITGISGVPAIWMALLASEARLVHGCFDQVRYLTVSGGDMAPAQLKRLQELASNTGIYKTYGQTETFRSGILFPEDYARKMTSVGKPVARTDVFIVNSKGNRVKPNEVGQIIHRGEGTMLGYVSDKKATGKKLRHHPCQPRQNVYLPPVIYTGDIGKIDEDGFIYVLGRRDKMIKIRGNRIYPKEILDIIQTHDHIKEAIVFGIKNKAGETEIYAEVQLKPRSTLKVEELTYFLAQNLPSYTIPSKIFFVDTFPQTSSGKIKLSEVEAKYHDKG